MSGVAFRALVVAILAAANACASNPTTATLDPTRTQKGPASDAGAAGSAPTKCTLVAISDLHGHLTPPVGRLGSATIDGRDVPVGGVAYLATHVANGPRESTFFVSSGDLFGASPLISSLYRDEPTVEVMNAMGLRFNALGNHEFDRGVAALQRLAFGDSTFPGAKFPFLGANVTLRGENRAFAPSYFVECGAPANRVRIAFIGLPLRGTPGVTTLGKELPVDFGDEAEAVNREVERLAKSDVTLFAVALHDGGIPSGTDPNECGIDSGYFRSMIDRFDPRVKLVLSGHTHKGYICRFGDRLVTSTEPYGRMYTRVTATFDGTGLYRDLTAKNFYVTQDVAPNPEVQAIVTQYEERAKPEREKVVGHLREALTDKTNDTGESPLGLLIADAQLEATRGPKAGRADVAFMNPGGVRSDLTPGAKGVVTFEQAHAVQPFGNRVVTMTLTGAQIFELLEAQFQERKFRLLFPSHGFEYVYDASKSKGRRIVSAKLDGRALDPKKTVRVTVNSFLAQGGDAFSVLEKGTDRVSGVNDLLALTAYLKKHDPAVPPTPGRIKSVAVKQ